MPAGLRNGVHILIITSQAMQRLASAAFFPWVLSELNFEFLPEFLPALDIIHTAAFHPTTSPAYGMGDSFSGDFSPKMGRRQTELHISVPTM